MGGGFMWPLLMFSVATVGIALERVTFLVYHNLRLDDLKDAVLAYIRKNDMEGARDYLYSLDQRRLGARILLALVSKSQLSEHQMEKAAEAEAASCINSLEDGFNFLTALGSLSPLTGFLGTVSGMIGAFKSIAEATDVNAQIVANGIYEALITTVFGLIIAIIAMVAHSLLSNVVDKFTAEVEKTCTDILMEIVIAKSKRSKTGQSPFISLEEYS
jgi:biopolymer transport protein ExbB